MTPQSQKIIEAYQVRKSRKQKEAFRNWLCEELKKAGCSPRVETSFTAANVIIGDPETAKVIFSAHYDTCAVLPIPNLITPRNMFIYFLYQMVFLMIFFAAAFVLNFILFSAPDIPRLAAPICTNILCLFMIWWILDGKANKHTANDNTSGVLALMEIALAMPEEGRKKACFVFFDNEEKGLFGSAAFTKAHKKAKKETLNINFDCVSDGDYIQFFPGKRLKEDEKILRQIEDAFQGRNGKQVEVVRGAGFYPSDNKAFWKGVGVCALRYKKGIGFYMGRIHTNRDTVLEEENIALLRDGALRFVEKVEI